MGLSTFGKVVLALVSVVGLLCCILGGVYYQKFPDLARKQIEEALPIKEGSDAFDRWSESTVPVYWKATFFNVTNYEEINNNASTIPILREVEQVVLKQAIDRWNITFFDNGTVLQYAENRTYYHVSGDIDAQVYHINPTYVLGSQFLELLFKAKVEKAVAEGKLQLVEKHSIREILFDGYESEVVKILRPALGSKYPGDNFALYSESNGTLKDAFKMATGTDDIQNIGAVKEFLPGGEKRKKSTIWSGHCGDVNGTDATFFHPGISKDEELFIFTSELTRSASLIFEKETVVKDIEAYRFVLPDDTFKVTVPENLCFCSPDLCKDGVMKLKDSQKPIVFSAPHFLYGASDLLESVDGLEPQAHLHESHVTIEPNTGVTVDAAKRIQANVHLVNRNLPFLKTASGTIFPIAWLEESAQIDEDTARKFRKEVLNKLKLVPNLLIALMCLGIFLILLSTVICIFKRKR